MMIIMVMMMIDDDDDDDDDDYDDDDDDDDDNSNIAILMFEVVNTVGIASWGSRSPIDTVMMISSSFWVYTGQRPK